jgi:hypothetical protein
MLSVVAPFKHFFVSKLYLEQNIFFWLMVFFSHFAQKRVLKHIYYHETSYIIFFSSPVVTCKNRQECLFLKDLIVYSRPKANP